MLLSNFHELLQHFVYSKIKVDIISLLSKSVFHFHNIFNKETQHNVKQSTHKEPYVQQDSSYSNSADFMQSITNLLVLYNQLHYSLYKLHIINLFFFLGSAVCSSICALPYNIIYIKYPYWYIIHLLRKHPKLCQQAGIWHPVPCHFG